jgi:hypothetical protein
MLTSSLKITDYEDSMAVCGVSCEPLSKSNSLLTGNLTVKS